MRRLILALLVLAAAPAFAQQQETGIYNVKYDVDSTSLTYCTVTGQQGSPFGSPNVGPSRIQTSGSSTTVTEVTASSAPFTLLSVGDIIFVKRPGTTEAYTTDTAIITAKASGSSITIDSAVDWSAGYAFTWLKTNCGTGATNGWIDVNGYSEKTFVVQWDQGDLDSLDWLIECKSSAPGAQPVQVYPDNGGGAAYRNFAVAGHEARTAYITSYPWAACRVGFKAHASDASDAGANLEQFSASVMLSLRR